MSWESSELFRPTWADPIKSRVRQSNQAKAINEVINALKPSQDSAGQSAALHVVNGMSTSSSIITTAARLSPVDGLPERLGISTIRLGGGLTVHPEFGEHDNDDPAVALPRPSPRPINPSLVTLEKAVSARSRIYFGNLYFPLLRQPPSREQRRVAMENRRRRYALVGVKARVNTFANGEEK
ncbi:hypothetical protein K503DRAFT_818958 [Rhizopogon vinicolor AM-OR11-026]|uniref:Uncharacterized protein n=1 Tax=Rhizopogon vinicolor AM-OR11-026 TaxID=1314800 RepID=A0A1B7MZT1_9AGAM|nr:hypothetical protein K503DRAFT_818958 [Rhizopogon vinicolor AM-OR11-026]